MPSDVTLWLFFVWFCFALALGLGWAMGNKIIAKLLG